MTFHCQQWRSCMSSLSRLRRGCHLILQAEGSLCWDPQQLWMGQHRRQGWAQTACGLGKRWLHIVHLTSPALGVFRSGWLKGMILIFPACELAVVGLLGPNSRPSVHQAGYCGGRRLDMQPAQMKIPGGESISMANTEALAAATVGNIQEGPHLALRPLP